jgi:hypothetical protein
MPMWNGATDMGPLLDLASFVPLGDYQGMFIFSCSR